ncbi:cytochrome P450 734A1-like isoform X2 [Cryptomeria japonica]|uniref:cytochrome P450 734A1-like isoform X2 n=1 Tax=Cryptomeria japonica TaxID=3369 RepID=UPI0027DAAEFC|nr:cytochrome P450 734A1-like isoform X2 [Cryptomeria japonica]
MSRSPNPCHSHMTCSLEFFPIYISGAEFMVTIMFSGLDRMLGWSFPILSLLRTCSTKFDNYSKLPTNPLSRQLVGQGLVGLTGEKWARHRKIINPAFHMDLLKGMIPTIIESSANMLEEWSKLVLSGASEIEVLKEFRELTADIIARTAFGSSFIEGKDIFDMQAKQMVLTSELFHTVYIPGFRFLPTAKNR